MHTNQDFKYNISIELKDNFFELLNNDSGLILISKFS